MTGPAAWPAPRHRPDGTGRARPFRAGRGGRSPRRPQTSRPARPPRRGRTRSVAAGWLPAALRAAVPLPSCPQSCTIFDNCARSCIDRLFRIKATTAPLWSTGTIANSMNEGAIRAALDVHWAASDGNDFDTEHQIYLDDAVLEYPQSGERIRGRHNIQASRMAQPNMKRFTVRRIVGAGNLWVTEFILTYDGRPSYSVSIMEFRDGKVARETQYFGDPFEPGPSRAHLVERMG